MRALGTLRRVPPRNLAVCLKAGGSALGTAHATRSFWLVNSIAAANSIDASQLNLENTPQYEVARKLIQEIEKLPENLYLLLFFHHKLAALGITATSPRDFTPAQVWRYRAAHVLSLARIHNVFWENCRFVDISNQSHGLGFSPLDIGALDPANFKDEYADLQAGTYKGLDFRDVQLAGMSRAFQR